MRSRSAVRILVGIAFCSLLSVALAAGVPAQGSSTCDMAASSWPNRTALLEQRPRHVYGPERFNVTDLVVKQTGGDRAPTDAQIVVANESPAPVLEAATAEFSSTEEARLSVPLAAPDVFPPGSNTAELGICLDGVEAGTAPNQTLDTWTIERLASFNLTSSSLSYFDGNESFDPPDRLPTSASTAILTVSRDIPSQDLQRHRASEERGALELAVDATAAPACDEDRTEEIGTVRSTNRKTNRGSEGWADDGSQITMRFPLSGLPACEVELQVGVYLHPAHCVPAERADCRVSTSNTTVSAVIRQPWTFPSTGTPGDLELPTVWARQNSGFEDLQKEIDEWTRQREHTISFYDRTAEGSGPINLNELSEAQTGYNDSVQAVRESYASLAGGGLPYAENHEELKTSWEEIVREDERSFQADVDERRTTLEEQASEQWATVRQDFLIGFAAAFVMGSGATAAFTVRWHRKKEYWSMFSSKANFTHPLHVATALASAAVLIAIAWGLVDETFRFQRLFRMSNSVTEVLPWI